MSLRTIFKLISATLAILVLSVLLVMVVQFRTLDAMEAAEKSRYESLKLADELQRSSDELTRMARTYVVTGDSRYEDYFLRVLAIRNGEAPRPEGYDGIYWDRVVVEGDAQSAYGEVVALEELMRRANFSDAEFAKLRQAQRESDALAVQETRAMAAVKGLYPDASGAYTIEGVPDLAQAQELMHSDSYHAAKQRIMVPIGEFVDMVEARTQGHLQRLRVRSSTLMLTALVLVSLSLGLVLLSIIVYERRIFRPVRALVSAARSIESGRYSERVARQWPDEIGHLAGTFNHMAEAIETDIDERRKTARALREARVAADTANVAKGDFLANMSHEIRTPMNAIVGMTHLALRTELTARQRAYLVNVRAAADSLLGIINDILDFSKIEAGKLELEHIQFSIEELLGRLRDLLAGRAHEKGLELLFDLDPSTPDTLLGDPTRLGQILDNLTNNAIKFTESGEVIVRVTTLSREADSVRIRFSVADTGIGIDAQQQERLFKPFSQADNSTTRRYGGSGLGLAICRDLAERMEGRIWVESEPGRGSTFGFDVAFETERGIGGAAPRLDDTTKLERALVVDDNAAAREILQQMLESIGVPSSVTGSGREAVAELESASTQSRPYRLVLMDWKMPHMDGVETTRRIRASGVINVQPVVIMVSAYSREEALHEVGDAGPDAFLAKPVSPSSLFNAIAEQFPGRALQHARATSEECAASPVSSQLRGARILLVEDHELNQELALELLRGAGTEVTLATNGEEALRMIQEQSFDGVLMDIQMPVMDGYEATRQIRQRPGLRDLPIIAVTANAMAGDREKALAAGMNDHIAKPMDIDKALATLAKWIRPVTPAAEPEVSAPEPEPLSGVQPAVLPVIDVAAGLAVSHGDQALYQRLLQRFVESERDFPARFASALENRDFAAATRLAHSLKGVAGNIGALGLQDKARVLEAAAAGGEALSIDAALAAVVAQLARVLDGLVARERSGGAPRAQRAMPQQSTARLLECLATLIDESDADAVEQAERLRQHPDLTSHREITDRMLKCLRGYDFDGAAAVLAELRLNAGSMAHD